MKPLEQWTEQEIDALQEGRETDAIIAEAMGWEKVRCNEVAWFGRPPGGQFSTIDIPAYSSDIGAAFPIGERMRELGQVRYYAWSLDRLILADAEGRDEFMSDGEHHYALSQASPLQRCKAALKAMRAMRLRESAR